MEPQQTTDITSKSINSIIELKTAIPEISKHLVLVSDYEATLEAVLPNARIIAVGSAEFERWLLKESIESEVELLSFAVSSKADVGIIKRALDSVLKLKSDIPTCALAFRSSHQTGTSLSWAITEILGPHSLNIETLTHRRLGTLDFLFFKKSAETDQNKAICGPLFLAKEISAITAEKDTLLAQIKALQDEIEFLRAAREGNEGVLIFEKINNLIRASAYRESELRTQIRRLKSTQVVAPQSNAWLKFAVRVDKLSKLSLTEFIAYLPRMFREIYNLGMLQWERLWLRKGKAPAAKPSPVAGSIIVEREANPLSYAFLPINGAGLGHLTRCLAVAKALKKDRPNAEICFITTSVALPIVHQAGFVAYNIPTYAKLSTFVSRGDWNQYFYSQIENACRIHSCSKIVFDGTLPYPGIVSYLAHNQNIKGYWIRRGLYKDDSQAASLKEAEKHFAKVLIPGEIDVDQSDPSNPNVHHVAPILMLPEASEILDRENACRALGLNPNSRNIYIQMGAGNINDIQLQQTVIYNALSELPNVSIIVAESPIKEGANVVEGRFRSFKDYPNTRFYSAFDLAISAAGYNSVYESVALGLKTIFLPNESTGADNQVERSRIAERCGVGAVYLGPFDKVRFLELVETMLAKPQPSGQLALFSGAQAASRILLE